MPPKNPRRKPRQPELWLGSSARRKSSAGPTRIPDGPDFKTQLETLNEELEGLNAQARELEQIIANNVAEILRV